MSLWLHLKPEQVGNGRERKKINTVVLFCFNPTRNRKFQKKSKKIQKNYTIPLWLHFEPKQVEGGLESEKIKINVSFRSNPVENRKCQKKSKKTKNYRFVPFLPDALQKIPKK